MATFLISKMGTRRGPLIDEGIPLQVQLKSDNWFVGIPKRRFQNRMRLRTKNSFSHGRILAAPRSWCQADTDTDFERFFAQS